MNSNPSISRLKALADPTRLRLLRLLEAETLTVGELTGILSMAQSRVSGHLAVLREAGLVSDRRQGTSVFYTVVPEGEARDTWNAVRATLPQEAQHRDDARRLAEARARRQERGREFFDRVAAGWDETRSESMGYAAGTAAMAGLLPRRLTVIDLGTGTGSLLPLLARQLDTVWAVDSSLGMLSRARERVEEAGLDNVGFVHGELTQLPMGDHSVDGVIANMVLHHLDEPQTALREMARVLRPQGNGVIVDFAVHDETWLLQEEGHRWAGFDPAQLGAWCVDAGLTVPTFAPVPTPEGGRWSRLQVFTARFTRRSRR